MKKYLNNPYVLIGLVGIAFYLYKRNQLLKQQPKAEKSVEELEETTNFVAKEEEEEEEEAKEEKGEEIPKALIKDAKKMSKSILQRTIATNVKMLKRAKMSKERREKIKTMIKYLKREYARRVSKK